MAGNKWPRGAGRLCFRMIAHPGDRSELDPLPCRKVKVSRTPRSNLDRNREVQNSCEVLSRSELEQRARKCAGGSIEVPGHLNDEELNALLAKIALVRGSRIVKYIAHTLALDIRRDKAGEIHSATKENLRP